MTSRDFGFTTLRSAVAYRPDNSIVSPNNVYITKTNGAAVFSDTLKISTINVSTATISTLTVSTINGGSGGGQVLSQSGDNILLSGGGGSVNVSQTTTVSTTTQKTTALTYNAGIQLSNFSSNLTVGAPGAQTIRMIDGDIGLFGNATQVRFVNTSNNTVGYLTYTSTSNDLRLGSALPLTINSQSTITLENTTGGDIILNSQSGRFRTLAIDGRMDFVGGDLIITASGHNIDIIAAATRFQNMINVSSMLNDNNGFGGTAGQVLTAGTGGQVIWSTISSGGGSVNSVIAGSNIAILGTASNPIVNVDINSTLLMNGYPIYDNNAITIAASNIINLSTLSTSIILDQTHGITLTANDGININGSTLFNGSINVASTFYDNNVSSGTAGQVLTAGTGGQVIWSTISSGDGSVNSVIAGTNISTSGTATNPVVSVHINSTLYMNGNSIISNGNLGIQTDNTVSDLFLGSGRDIYINTISDKIYIGAGKDVIIGSSAGNIILSASTLSGNLAMTAGNTASITARILTLPSLANASAPKMLYYNTSTKAVSYSDPPIGSVNSVIAGTNISTSGTATNPVVNVNINSTLLMNGYPIYDNNAITIAASNNINLSTLSTSIVLDQTSQDISVTAGNDLNFTVGSTGKITATGTALLSNTASVSSNNYLCITINGTPYRIPLLTELNTGWATRIAGIGFEEGRGVTIDSNNNIIVTGPYYSNPVTIYNAPGTSGTLTLDNSNSSSSTTDAYIVKYDSDGISKWATRIAGIGDEYGYGVTVDSTNDIIVTGSYTSSPVTIYNAPGTSGTLTLNNSGATDAYIVKYDSYGISKWATRIAGTGSGIYVSIDSNNDIIVIGSYTSNPVTIYNAAPSVLTRTLYNSGSSSTNTYIVKYGSDGISKWATRIGGIGDVYGYSVAVDSNNDIIVTGYYSSDPVIIYDADGNVTLPNLSNAGGNIGSSDVYIVKYNGSTGIGIWAARIAGIGNEYGINIIVDSNNDIIVTGYYTSNPVTIYNSDGNVTLPQLNNSGSSGYTNDAYIVKYGSNGIGKWATRIAGASDDAGNGITVDSNDNIIVTGYYSSNPVTIYNAAPSVLTKTLSNSGSLDAYIVKYDSDGISKWATKIAGTGTGNGEIGNSVAVDSNDNIIAIGRYQANPVTIYNADGLMSRTLNNSGSADVYIVKYNANGFAN